MISFADVQMDSHSLIVEFDYTEGKNGLMDDIKIIKVALRSRSGDNDRPIRGYDDFAAMAVQDIHDCHVSGGPSYYGEWDGPRIGEAYDGYEEVCAEARAEEERELQLIEESNRMRQNQPAYGGL